MKFALAESVHSALKKFDALNDFRKVFDAAPYDFIDRIIEKDLLGCHIASRLLRASLLDYVPCM